MQKKDEVEIVKAGSSHYGRVAVVLDPEWNPGMVKVDLDGETKSYQREHLRLITDRAHMRKDLRSSKAFDGREHLNHRQLFSRITLLAALTTDKPLDGHATIFEIPPTRDNMNKGSSKVHRFVMAFRGTQSGDSDISYGGLTVS